LRLFSKSQKNIMNINNIDNQLDATAIYIDVMTWPEDNQILMETRCRVIL